MGRIRLTESQLHRVIRESVKKVLRENAYRSYRRGRMVNEMDGGTYARAGKSRLNQSYSNNPQYSAAFKRAAARKGVSAGDLAYDRADDLSGMAYDRAMSKYPNFSEITNYIDDVYPDMGSVEGEGFNGLDYSEAMDIANEVASSVGVSKAEVMGVLNDYYDAFHNANSY